MEDALNGALEKIEAGFEKLKWLAIINIVFSSSLLVYMFFYRKK